MRFTALGLLFLATGAFAEPQTAISKEMARGEEAIKTARGEKGTKVLRALEAAKPHFRRARGLAGRGLEGAPGDAALVKAKADATARLVAILNAETAIYLDRGALSLARRRNAEALELLPTDDRAKALEDAAKNPEPHVFDASLVDTILGRDNAFARAKALGALLRDRNVADRRFLERRTAVTRG